jgi:hypothetical protein
VSQAEESAEPEQDCSEERRTARRARACSRLAHKPLSNTATGRERIKTMKRRMTITITTLSWKDGEDCIIVPAVTDGQAKEKFPGGWKTIKPYLRVVPQPNK